MNQDSRYVLDANVFIEAARRYYAFDIAPPFWRSLEHFASIGRICSIDRVKKELERGKDELANWVKERFSNAFLPADQEDVIQIFSDIMNWIQESRQYFNAAKSEFAQSEDGWVVAYAKANNLVVVTQEVLAPEARKRIPFPNVCKAFNVPYVDTFEMLRSLRVKFN